MEALTKFYEFKHYHPHTMYDLSTDYELLWALIFDKKQRIAAWLIYTNRFDTPIWDLVEVKKAPGYNMKGAYFIGSRGVGYEGSRTIHDFTHICKRHSLHFIIP